MVSGANRGIGLAVARALARDGYRLSLGVRRPQTVPADLLSDTEDVLVCAYAARARPRCGRRDVLVNNAGIAPFVGLEDGSDEALQDLFEVNVTAPFRLIQAALPHLK